MRRAATAALLSVGLAWPLAPAHADDTVVVPGTAFPALGTSLTYFGCTDLFHADTRGPSVRVTRDPAAPLGRRAAELQLPGTGTAAGSVSLVGSVSAATHTMAVSAAAGSRGVAYVWYRAAGMAPGEVWAGRADLTAVGSGWQSIDAAAATYTWSRVVGATGAVSEEPGAATIDDFTAAHGDGPGYLMAGLGCDGSPFGLDAIQVGVPGSVTTYDLEGWSVSTSITSSRVRVLPNEEVTLEGMSLDASSAPMGSALVLEARRLGDDSFRAVTDPLTASPDGRVTITVSPEVTTDYRWFFEDRSYADAHWSPTVTVVVERPKAP